MKNVALTLWIVILLIAAGFGVGTATQAGVLIPTAVPFSLVLVLIMFFMGAKAELISWAAFTAGLLGGTYLQTGEPIEYGIFVVYILLTALGLFKSPYFLALAWLFHPVWDFLPRNLPAPMHDLPLACAFFDTPIGLYLLWGSWKKRWHPFGRQTMRGAFVNSARLFWIGILILGVSYALVTSTGTGYLHWVGLVAAGVVLIGFRLSGRGAEWMGLAMLTGWLGMTYAHTGGIVDAVVFLLYVVVSALGYFKSPYLLTVAWLAFIPWSFVPHALTQAYPDFPMATLFYCLPIGLYIFWGARTSRWNTQHINDSLAPVPA